MTNVDKWREAVKRIAEQTAEGKVRWTVMPDVKRENMIGSAYQTMIMNSVLVCYEYRTPTYTGTAEPEWSNEVAIEFVRGIDGTVEYRVPETPHDRALLDAIRYHASGAASFLDGFLQQPYGTSR